MSTEEQEQHELIDEPPPPEVDPTPSFLRRKILHVLSIYPRISPSMLHIGLGPGLPAQMYKPELQKLIDTGQVKSTEITKESPSGRQQVYSILEYIEPVAPPTK